jgi:hypothetical protein
MTHDDSLLREEALPQEENHVVPIETLNPGDAEAIDYLKREVAGGNHWYPALLGAIGLWTSAEEFHNGRLSVYLIDGEAFDWLMLAERLTEIINAYIPAQEREDLLFRCIPPLQLEAARVRELIGDKKYGMYLNYFYGVTVEEALLLAVQAEVDKERHVQCLVRNWDSAEEAFKRIYDTDRETLLQQFRLEKNLAKTAATSLEEMKQFTYWLFKYRFKRCERARIASDTQKALRYLNQIWGRKGVCQALAVDLAPSFS